MEIAFQTLKARPQENVGYERHERNIKIWCVCIVRRWEVLRQRRAVGRSGQSGPVFIAIGKQNQQDFANNIRIAHLEIVMEVSSVGNEQPEVLLKVLVGRVESSTSKLSCHCCGGIVEKCVWGILLRLSSLWLLELSLLLVLLLRKVQGLRVERLGMLEVLLVVGRIHDRYKVVATNR